MARLTTQNGDPISKLAFGTMQWGQGSDPDQSRAVFDACRAAEINSFDCAHVYCEGRSEELLGEFAKDERSALFITTKGGYTGGASAQNLTEQFEISLDRLQMDVVDLYFLHRFDPNTALEETLGWMKTEQERGRIRYLGLSNFAAWQIMKSQAVAHSIGTKIDAMQPMYNLVKRQAEVELLPMAIDQDIAVFPYSPLGGGLLSGKYSRGDAEGRLASDTRYRARYGLDWMWDTADGLTAMANEMGTHPASLAVAWVARNPAVTAPLISARTVEQLQPSLTPPTLTDDDYDAITALSQTPPPATDRIEETGLKAPALRQKAKASIAVIGSGLIGSAAGKYLAEAGHDVTLIGPTEPEDTSNHTGVFGSHYDEGRITRAVDPSPFWSEVTIASIARYRDIEKQSGISFFSDVGALVAGPAPHADIRSIQRQLKTADFPVEALGANQLNERLPMFHFPQGTAGFYEAENAGHISPRKLVAAQRILAQKAGATLRNEEVLELALGSKIRVKTESGYSAFDKVLLTTGGFARHLSPIEIPLKTYARTVAFFQISDAEADRLKGQPSLVYRFPDGRDPYLLPPIKYPDGNTYVKIGGDPEDIELDTQDEIIDWFRSGGSPQVTEHLHKMVLELMPNLKIEDVYHSSCVTSFTPDDRPTDISPEPGLHIVAGACGKGAKCSDELGRRAAMNLQEQLGGA